MRKPRTHDLEDNGANPNIWAVSFYGPPAFRDALETLPESLPDGAPARTFSGAAYWLIHHLRDSDSALKLTLDSQTAREFKFTLANDSSWLDLAPVARARFEKPIPTGVEMKWMIGDRNVTREINGEGLVFNRDLRLEPEQSRVLTLEVVIPVGQQTFAPIALELELLAHPSTPVVKQSLALLVAQHN